jgi:hypothetical protein
MSEFQPGDIFTKGRRRYVLTAHCGPHQWAARCDKLRGDGWWVHGYDDAYVIPRLLIAKGWTHTRPVRDVPEPTPAQVKDAIGEYERSKPNPRTPVSVTYSDGTSEAVTGWGFTNIDTSICDLSGNKTATEWKYDAGKCCGPLSGTECAAMVADMRSPGPPPPPPPRPPPPPPPVDEPWFTWDLWWEYLTEWYGGVSERNTYGDGLSFTGWLWSEANSIRHAQERAEQTITDVRTVQAARKRPNNLDNRAAKPKGGGK